MTYILIAGASIALGYWFRSLPDAPQPRRGPGIIPSDFMDPRG